MKKHATKKYIIDDANLMSKWNVDKNKMLGFYPDKITYGSAKKVWWKCVDGHEWQATPNHISRGRDCPICAEEKRKFSRTKNIISRRGSLAQNNYELASQWHPILNEKLTPFDVTINSAKRVWWKCSQGHEWEAPINSRNSGSGCPICSGHKILVGYNDLATVNPNLAKQWHPVKNIPLKPTDVTVSNAKKVWWLGECGHEWEAKISNRTNGCDCPICAGKQVLVGYNDLLTLNPQVAKEWHPTKNDVLTPKDVVAGSNKKAWWMCCRGHEWKTAISHRNNGERCPVCFGELKTSFPEQAIFFYLRKKTSACNRYKIDKRFEIDIYLPEYSIGIEYDGIYYHSSQKSIERDKRKEEILRTRSIKLIRVKEISKDILCQNDEEYIIYSSSSPKDNELNDTIKKVIARVEKIAKITLDVDVDVSRDRSEIYGQYIYCLKENSLFATCPTLVDEWHPTKNGTISSDRISPGSNKCVWWKCDAGHEWQANINSRRKGAGCPYCAGQRPIKGENDLETTHPSVVKRWCFDKNGALMPSDVTYGSNKKVWWTCDFGHEFESTPYEMSRGRKCPICKKTNKI